MYRGERLASNLVDLDLSCSTLCLVLTGLMGNRQKWLSRLARWGNIPKQSQPNPFANVTHPSVMTSNFIEELSEVEKIKARISLRSYLTSAGVSTSLHMPNCVSFADIDWPGSNRAPGESLGSGVH